MDKEQLLQNGFKEIKLISAKEHKTILFTDYMINREGQIWSFKTDKMLDGTTSRKGYKMYSLHTVEKGKYRKIIVGVHVLIASTFFDETNINNIDDNNTFEVVHHIDHNKNNNNPSNLLWISKVEHDKLHSKSDITRRKISESMKGRHLSEEHRRKISENHADISGENHPMYGKHHSEETRRKMSESHKGKTGANCSNSIKIIAFTNSGSYYKEFAGINDAGRELGIAGSSISKCCKGKRKSAGKYNGEPIRWKYKES